MKPKNYEVLMDIYMGVINAPAIQFTTEDFGMCQITFSLLEDRITPYNLSNCIVRMVINGQQQDCTISDANNGKAEIVLLQSMFTEVGHVFAELQIYDATNQTMRLTTPTFKYTVRKSLMDDNTVQADANYSILQQMILNVSNADKVSSEALKIANNAKAICDDLVPKANTAAQNAQTALDRAESVVTQEELAQKVMLGGKDTKFDFIENKVVSDNLSKQGIVLSNTDGWITNGSYPYTLIFKTVRLNSASWFLVGNGGWGLSYFDDYICITDVNGPTIQKLFPVKQGEQLSLAIQQTKDGLVEAYSPKHGRVVVENSKLVNLGGGTLRGTGHGYDVDFLIYNRILIQQELQQNFLALDNSPSIKELHTTDSTGKTSILNLASSEDFVEMSTGRTLREEYMGVLKTMGKEFTSADGSPIQVPNGIEARLISGEIKGQTVKNILPTENIVVLTGDGTNWKTRAIPLSKVALAPTKKYTLYTFVYENTLNYAFEINQVNPTTVLSPRVSIEPKKVGVFVNTLTSIDDFTGKQSAIRCTVSQISETGTIKFRQVLVEGENTNLITSYIPFGLSSTQAIISNNGQQYPIYEPTIQGKTRILDGKLVSLEPSDPSLPKLGSTPMISDTLDRASGVLVENTKEMIDSDFKAYNQNETTYKLSSENVYTANNSLVNCIITSKDLSGVTLEQATHIGDGKYRIAFCFDKIITGVNSLQTALNYMKEQGLKFRANIVSPIKTQLIPEQLKAYDSHKKVISCKKVGDVSDTFETREDGSGVVTNKLMNIDFSKGIPNGIGVNPNGTDSDNFVTVRLNGIIQPVSFVGICNKFNTWNGSATYDNKHIFRYGNEIYFVIPREEIAKYGYTGNDVVDEVNNNARRNYLIQEGIQVLYEVAPTTTHIPKELVPTILTHNQTNILEVGGAVKPSSFKMTLPVDRIAELTARLEAVEAKTNTQPVNTAFVDETYAKSVNKIEEVIK